MNIKSTWNIPPENFFLSNQDLHVWRAALDLKRDRIQEYSKWLSNDEMEKAESYYSVRDKDRYVVARGILRTILASYSGTEPAAIRFCYEENGKPVLLDPYGKKSIYFNVSHSEGLALYVFARSFNVGIDVEFMRDISEMDEIVKEFFSAKERICFDALPAGERKKVFFKWWTLKEAYTKATGRAVFHSSDEPDVLALIDEQENSWHIMGNSDDASTWSISDITPDQDCAGAIAVEGTDFNIHYWHWPNEHESVW